MKVFLDGEEIDLGEIDEDEETMDYVNPKEKKQVNLDDDTIEISDEELEIIRNNKNDEPREN